jgi:hypothetical protein
MAGPIVRPALLAGDVEAAVDIAHLKHLIPQNDLLPIPRPGRHSHFSVRLALDDDGDPIAGRELSPDQENYRFLISPTARRKARHITLEDRWGR